MTSDQTTENSKFGTILVHRHNSFTFKAIIIHKANLFEFVRRSQWP